MERVRYYGAGNVDYLFVWSEEEVLRVTAFGDSQALPVRVDFELSREQMEQLRDQLDRALNAKEES